MECKSSSATEVSVSASKLKLKARSGLLTTAEEEASHTIIVSLESKENNG